MKLYLGKWIGNGLPGYTTVDIQSKYSPDVICDATNMSSFFKDGTIDEIYAGHVVEHLWEPIKAFRHWYNLLKPGGKLGIIVPDAPFIILNYDEFKAFGMLWAMDIENNGVKGVLPPEGHAQLTDLESLNRWLTHVGFVDLKEIDRISDPRLFGGVPWQCGYDAYKPEEG